jgi:hypothetical protein
MIDQPTVLRSALWENVPEFRTAGNFSGDAFIDFYNKIKGRPPLSSLPQRIIAIDPGEMTGACIYHADPDMRMFIPFQKNTSIIEWAADFLDHLLQPSNCIVVIESYRIYAWRANEHKWASLLTPRIIGGVETLCRLRKIPLVEQSAQQGKAFMKGDERLKEWGLHTPGRPHQNDATKHLCNLLLFGDWHQ